ncbi:MAG TPA: tetratricopeptide repeat protein, partial [Saprospiraceae bacterium]|nr:tetratricopeptide repeat protein [Saprospiraceae bacterium]
MKVVSFILLAFLSALQSGQGQSLSRIVEAAEKSMATKNYFDALHKYREALEFNPDDAHFLSKAADAARQLGAYKIAAEYYDSVLKHDDNSKFPLTAFYLGQMRQIQGDYPKAIAAYQIFTSEYSGPDSSYIPIANKEILACEWAKNQLANPAKGVVINRLPDAINSVWSDFAPAVWNDQMVYSSLRFENTADKYIPKRYVSSLLKTDQKVESASTFIPERFVSPGVHLANCSFSKDYRRVFYTLCVDINDYDKQCDLYMSTIDEQMQWSKGEKLPEPINLPATSNTQPNLAYTDEGPNPLLYFASNRSGGKGGYDIWHTVIDSLGRFSEPVNCSELNTNQDDFSPFYHAKTGMMYYSSKGHLGMGGLDIYSSRLQDGHFSLPKNLGVPFNSSFDDLYFIITPQDTIAYQASNRTGTLFLDDATEACCLDLFQVKMRPCEIKLNALTYNYYTKTDLHGVTVKLFDLERPQSPAVEFTLDSSNHFKFDIRCDKNYKLVASKNRYSSDSTVFYSGEPGAFSNITKKLFLKPLVADLEVLTFHKITGDSLNGVTVTLIDLTDSTQAPITLTKLESNLFPFQIIPCHRYKLIASKEEFANTEAIIQIDCGLNGKMIQKLYLSPVLYSLLPVSLYFDNDRPNPATMNPKTYVSYHQTY